MKKIQRRAYFAVIISMAIVVGMGIFLFRFFAYGGDWASMRANPDAYNQGALDKGTLTDRNGIMLASAADGVFKYADDATTRKACLHAVGDYAGNFGTGALSCFNDKLIGYNVVNGLNSLSEKGGTVRLSIDSKLNTVAYNALYGRRGAVLVSDYTTGEILCMVSSPSYDPNSPPDTSNPAYEGVYLNRCLSSIYTPGSVFKLITVAAAIENIPELRTMSFDCAGSVQVGGDVVKCTGWHGTQTIEQALANSCNCAFSQLSQLLGAEKIKEYTEKFSFLDNLTVSGITTAAGSFELAEEGSADLSWSGIGQFKDQVSPISMLRYVSAIGNGGTVREPVLIKDKTGSKTQLISAETAAQLANLMEYNVQYSYGSWMFPGLSVCAKSGTAEVGDGTSHAWFVGFLKDAEHPYAFTVVIENGGGGLSNAAPVANAVLQEAVK